MKGSVKVSVIMSVYLRECDRKDWMEMAVESILGQSLRNLEFLIYDDGSEEDMGDFLRKLAQRDSRIRYLKGTGNRGIAYGLNRCIQEAAGQYIARMDADDISLPGRLERQIEFLETHPEYDYVGCAAGLIDEQHLWGSRRMPKIPSKKDFRSFSPFIHPSVVFRKSVFITYGMYVSAEHMRRCEDYELFMRLHSFGCYGYNLQEELFWYREYKEGYQKRTFCHRAEEARLRRWGFAALGLTGIISWLYRYKPFAVGVLPECVYRIWKQYQAWAREERMWNRERVNGINSEIENGRGISRSLAAVQERFWRR